MEKSSHIAFIADGRDRFSYVLGLTQIGVPVGRFRSYSA
jgi:hypothetical protein